MYRALTLDEGMIHIPGGTVGDFYHPAENSVQFKLMNCLFLEFSI